jgi:Skp family chaperone for outer membrane proteins
VKIHLFGAALVAVVCSLGISTKATQAQAQSGPGGVAVIDISYIFKNHPRFTAMKDEIKRRVESADTEVKQRQETMASLAKQLDTLQKGSPDYRALDEDLTKKKADLNAMVALRRKDLMEQEAKMYFGLYSEIVDEVKWFAQQNHIALVVRYNGEPIEGEDPRGVMSAISNPIVYHSNGINITFQILEQLKRRQPASNATLPRPGVPRPR